MQLADARMMREALRIQDCAATVPLGYGPDRYFVQVWPAELRGEALRLETLDAAVEFLRRVMAHRLEEEERAERRERLLGR